MTNQDFSTMNGSQLVVAYNSMIKEASQVGLQGFRETTKFKDNAIGRKRCDALASSLKAFSDGQKKADEQPDDIPEFLKTKNRKPLTKEQEAKLNEQLKKNVDQKCAAKQDFTLPHNIDPAGLKLLEEKKQPSTKKVSMCRRAKQLITEDLSITADVLMTKLKGEGYDPKKSTISTVLSDLRDTVSVLVEAGLITK